MSGFVAGEVALFILARNRRFLARLEPGVVQHTHEGLIRHDEVIGQAPGATLRTHLGHPFLALRPSLYEVLMSLRRVTQIIYPKDIGYILLKLSVGPGSRIIECGTGSGVLTTALARAVGAGGRVYSYEQREDMLAAAEKNLSNVGLLDRVELKQRDAAEGFDETEVEALFLDVREPWLYLQQVWTALAPGGFFGAIVPTANQVSELIAGLEGARFGDIEVCEILLRAYKPVAARLRPTDRMSAHTGYLIFARRLEEVPQMSEQSPDDGASVEENAEAQYDGSVEVC